MNTDWPAPGPCGQPGGKSQKPGRFAGKHPSGGSDRPTSPASKDTAESGAGVLYGRNPPQPAKAANPDVPFL